VIHQADRGASEGARVLLVLNERATGDAVDCYRALRRLESEGIVDAWAVYPYLARSSVGVVGEAMIEEISHAVVALGATVLIFTHLHGVGVFASSVRRLRAAHPKLVLGFWEGDWYEQYRKPFPRESWGTCAECDIVFVCGDGYVGRQLKRHGCHDVRYVPLTGDDRFLKQPTQSTYEFDVTMICSLVTSRIPFKRMPGSSMRQRLAARFTSRFGSRFAVFGSGWSGPNAHGPVPYGEQAEAYGRSAVALGCNNLYAKYYFSDRLPIAMQAGRPMVHEFVEGAVEVFGIDSGVNWFRSVDEAVRLTEAVLGDPEGALRRAERAHLLAEDRFTTYHAMQYMICALSSKRSICPGVDGTTANPWITRDLL